jgi:hypothetical protein
MNIYSSIHPPLSNIQAELLKLFSADIPDKHLGELKPGFLPDKARDKADTPDSYLSADRQDRDGMKKATQMKNCSKY